MGSLKGVSRGKYKVRSFKQNGSVYCSNCSKCYKKKSSLLQHIRAVHLKVRMTCPKCVKKFIAVSSLNRHIRMCHDDQHKTQNSKSGKSHQMIVTNTDVATLPQVTSEFNENEPFTSSTLNKRTDLVMPTTNSKLLSTKAKKISGPVLQMETRLVSVKV